MRQRIGNVPHSGGRRDFMKAGGLAVGVLASEGCAVSRAATTSTTKLPRSAAFGWELANLNGNGANAYFSVPVGMVLNSVNVDVSAMPLAVTGAGYAEILCYGGISRQAVPTFDNSGAHDYTSFALSSDFGSVTIVNPNSLTVAYDGALSQDKFVSVILKTWVPSDGTASATARNVTAYPSLTLNAGDYLVFHMDHAGVSVDAEMQVVINYTPS
jgi:hypothetical protein